MSPTFYCKHHQEVAALLGNSDYKDELVQDLTNKFGEFFQKDNERFDFTRFQSMVTRVREGR